jgi:SAM-dependent methyltransferase
VNVIRSNYSDLARLSVYELSSRGMLVKWLETQARSLATSEYIPDVPLGGLDKGVRCEDVQNLTFEDSTFDLCTSTEVFEHVADDHAGFSEVHRVLRAGGVFIFTVPLSDKQQTVERASLIDGKVVNLLEPEYHGDPFSENESILCFRNYGEDIIDRLISAGFSSAELVEPEFNMMRYARTVVVAKK